MGTYHAHPDAQELDFFLKKKHLPTNGVIGSMLMLIDLQNTTFDNSKDHCHGSQFPFWMLNISFFFSVASKSCLRYT